MKHKVSVTIGIPAFNEEANIVHLLNAIVRQKKKTFKLEKVLIISDGSTDRTVNKILLLKKRFPLISLISRKVRKGIATAQNEIVTRAKSDILVMLDADIMPANDKFLEEIIAPFCSNPEIGLVGASTASVKPRGFIESVLAYSHEFKQSLYRKINNGDTVYLCHGRARAFKKKLYKRLYWNDDVPEDAFSYLYCISNKMKFIYQPNATILFRTPTSIMEHAKQSKRFADSIKALSKYKKRSFIEKQYIIPKKYFISTFMIFLIKNPIKMFTYLWIQIYVSKFINLGEIDHKMHLIATSSKNLQ